MKQFGLILLCLLAWGICTQHAEARHGYRVRVVGAYPVMPYYVPAPAYYAPVVPVSPYRVYGYRGPAAFVAPTPFIQPGYYPYYGPSPFIYGW